MIIKDHMAQDCPCTASCPRHGDCAACVQNHFSKSSLPACLRAITKQAQEKRAE
jgi:hypothetical protein